MNFHTAEDGHVYNDDKKSSSSHHGSVKPYTGVKLKSDVSKKSFEEILNDIPEIQESIKTSMHKTKRGRFAGIYSNDRTMHLKLGDNEESVKKLLVKTLYDDIKKLRVDGGEIYINEDTPEQIIITKQYQYPRELDEEVKLYGFASKRRKVLAVYKKNENPKIYPLEDYKRNPEFT